MSNEINRFNYIQRVLGIRYVEQHNHIILSKEDFERISNEMEHLRKQADKKFEVFRNRYLGEWVTDTNHKPLEHITKGE